MTEAPKRIYMDPDIKFPECEKQYGCDIEYIRADHVDDLLRAKREKTIQRVVDAIGGLIDPDNRKAALQRLNDLIEKDTTDGN